MFKNLNELRDWHITQVAKYSRLSEINRSAASDKRNECIVKQLEKCAHNQDELVAVHDAAVIVVPKSELDQAVAFITEVMSTPPSWAEGLPVACEAKSGESYGDC